MSADNTRVTDNTRVADNTRVTDNARRNAQRTPTFLSAIRRRRPDFGNEKTVSFGGANVDQINPAIALDADDIVSAQKSRTPAILRRYVVVVPQGSV